MPVRKAVTILGISMLFISCALIWLGDLNLTTAPSEPEQILGTGESISIAFSEEVDRFSFESIFHLAGPEGDAEGDFLWEIGSVVFSPAGEMQPGFRYRMTINGELKTIDGKSFSKYIDIPFFYTTDDFPPLLVSASPEAFLPVDTNFELTLVFNKVINKDSFDEGFTINPASDFNCDWNSDATEVTISPDEAWINLKHYTWSVSTDVTDLDGIPLARKETGSFLVQLDLTAPSVTGVYPATDNGDGSFSVLTALTPDDLLLGQHLAITFSEDIDFTSLRQNLTLNPSIEGYTAALDSKAVLYYIEENVPPAAEYEMTIEAGLKDLSGNASIEDWRLTFTPDVPAQQIESVIIEDSIPPDLILDSNDYNEESYVTIPGLDYYGTDSLYFYINLSEGIPVESINERREFVSCASLSAVFPPGTPAPSLYSSDWVTDNRIRLIYENLADCTAGEPVYYRFKIIAGSFDSASPGGSYLTSGISFIFLAEEN